MALRLIIEDDEGTTTVVPLGADAITIGRQQGNTIQLTEKNVSRRHARLMPASEGWVIEDLGSYNGVRVNGSAVEGHAEFNEGDVVQIADYSLALTQHGNTAVAVAPTFPTEAATAEMDEPMLASSSTDLPQLTESDVAALQVPAAPFEPVAVAPAGAALPNEAAVFEEDGHKSNVGWLIGFGAVLLGAVVLGGAWLAKDQRGDALTPQVADRTNPSEAAAGKVLDANTQAAVELQAGAQKPPLEPADDPLSPTTHEDAADAPPPTTTPTKPATQVEQRPKRRPVAAQDSDDDLPKSLPGKRKPRAKQTPPVPEPAVDSSALLAEARRASLSDPAKCYDLAKQAYDDSRSAAASEMMAKCACKMGDAAKAKRAASRLKGDKRTQAEQLCELKGISL